MPLDQERTKTTMTRRSPAAKPTEKRAGAPRKIAPKAAAPAGLQADAPAADVPAGSPAEASSAPIAADPLERRRLIAEAAYFRAERRGFAAGAEEQDWLEAEAEVDAQLGASVASDVPPARRAPRRGARLAPGKASS